MTSLDINMKPLFMCSFIYSRWGGGVGGDNLIGDFMQSTEALSAPFDFQYSSSIVWQTYVLLLW